ncbi:HhH-GPD base excision DNA repair protein-related protein [Galdieria sulphuraria]|uniref:HhH-GPD base excision DNA repair protein-related protein n=1 Tax=Galdieria sulphuraria TaxID=130081 RepID=M2VVB2_GALSU|nr:HhH-GPD base excision DNA repair protein-related protein [Galdieria sulphuraria]EME27156.1 HhH-GPD base excision DNA repair protein-related protein [Galdieria sulphuraria]|eukprot:XP_005703676.1 HhH-GPD base excision DNA repair protein-related protein [Galdieria sulphuraria]
MFLQIDRQLIVSGFSYRLLLANFPKRFSLQLARGVFRKYWRKSLVVMQGEEKGTHFQKAYEVLSQVYPIPAISVGANTVLDTLIAVMLSQNTTDRNSTKAFEQLKTRYEDWNQVIEAPLRDVEECIRVAGLAKTKAARIKELLETLQKERGELSLESLRGSCTETVEKELSRFKGVGLKTMACVSAFSLGLQVFPGAYYYLEV